MTGCWSCWATGTGSSPISRSATSPPSTATSPPSPASPNSSANHWSAGTCRCSAACERCSAGDLDTADRRCGEVASAAEATESHNAAMMAATLALGIDAARGRTPDPAALEGLFDVDPADWASYAAGLAMVNWLAGDRDRARQLLKLHADNGFARLGEDGEQLTTLLLFGRVAAGLDEAAALRSVVRPAPAPRRSVGGRRDRRLLLGARRARVGSARARPRSASRRPRPPRPRPCQRGTGRRPAASAPRRHRSNSDAARLDATETVAEVARRLKEISSDERGSSGRCRIGAGPFA